MLYTLWKFINPSRTTNKLIFSLLLLLGAVSVSFVPPLIPWGSSKLHPLPLPPKEAICDAVRQQTQREPRGLWHTQLWADVDLPAPEEPQGRDPSGWLGAEGEGKDVWGKKERESSTVFKTPYFASFFTKAHFPVWCLFTLEVLEWCWILMRSLETPAQLSCVWRFFFFFGGKEHLSTFSLLSPVTCDSTSSFRSEYIGLI